MLELHTAADHDRFVAGWLCVIAVLLIVAALHHVRARVQRKRQRFADEANDPRDFGDGGIP